jgi:hypothetical protein
MIGQRAKSGRRVKTRAFPSITRPRGAGLEVRPASLWHSLGLIAIDEEEAFVNVELSAEVWRMKRVERLSAREIGRQTEVDA